MACSLVAQLGGGSARLLQLQRGGDRVCVYSWVCMAVPCLAVPCPCGGCRRLSRAHCPTTGALSPAGPSPWGLPGDTPRSLAPWLGMWRSPLSPDCQGDRAAPVGAGTAWRVRWRRGERCDPRVCLPQLCHGVAVAALAVPGRAVCTGVVCHPVCTGTTCLAPCVYQRCLPGCAWPGCVQAPCSGYACPGDAYGCCASGCGSWHTRGQTLVSTVQHLAGSSKGTPSPATSRGDVLLELLPALSLTSLLAAASTSSELPWPFSPEEPGQGRGIPAPCGGAASHQHPPGTVIVTQHRCERCPVSVWTCCPQPAPPGWLLAWCCRGPWPPGSWFLGLLLGRLVWWRPGATVAL